MVLALNTPRHPLSLYHKTPKQPSADNVSMDSGSSTNLFGLTSNRIAKKKKILKSRSELETILLSRNREKSHLMFPGKTKFCYRDVMMITDDDV